MSPHHTSMKKVEPIRSLKQLSAIKNMLRWQWKIRDLLLLELWVNSALRITDLLSLQTKHLYDAQTLWTIQKAISSTPRSTSHTVHSNWIEELHEKWSTNDVATYDSNEAFEDILFARHEDIKQECREYH